MREGEEERKMRIVKKVERKKEREKNRSLFKPINLKEKFTFFRLAFRREEV